MKNLLLLLLLTLGHLAAHATSYYVAATGGVNALGGGRGLSPGLPFATIQYAADQTLGGDTVFIRSGIYTNTGTAGSVFTIRRSGAAGAYITYRNYPGDAQRPLLRFNTYGAVGFANNVSYIQVIGLRIQGSNSGITLSAAINQPGGCAANGVGTVDPLYNGAGITINGRGAAATDHPHHITIRGNEVFECSQVGISAIQADYITIENNLVYNNSWYTLYGASGISVLSSWNKDNGPGYRTIVRNNRCFGNDLQVPWYGQGTCKGYTDGNGIIIDSNLDNGGYTGRTLVANNLLVDNGGAGITTFYSDHVDIINNTAWRNAKRGGTNSLGTLVPTYNGGEYVIAHAHDILMQNNIAVGITPVNTRFTSTIRYSGNVLLNANILLGGTRLDITNNDGPYTNTAPLAVDPQFVNPTTDWTTADFRLRATSPAINVGVNNLLSPTDLAGNPRVVGSAPDLGAYEYMPVPGTPSTGWLGGGTTDWNTAANWSNGVPTGSLNATIPANAAPYPVVAGPATVLGLSIDAGASLTQTGGFLDLKGSLTNNGTLTATGGTLSLTGSIAQTLGGPGSTQLWSLTLTNPAGAGLSGAVSLRGVLTPATGILATNGQTLTLLSDASGTALVNNSGIGTVSGNVTVQRYIDPSRNAGLGYRHYSAPVSNTTVADLTTSGFAPEISQAAAYNGSATPGAVTPFPTVFGYDQSRLATVSNNFSGFDKGYVVPAALSTPLAVGQGYAVNIGGGQLVDFVGTLNNGDLPLALTRNAAGSANATDAGWQLLGNPYPAPLDYSLVAPADRTGLDAAIYVFSSTSPYGGQYRSYVNGIGNPVLPLAQGFFARVSTGQTTGTLTLRNSHRLAATGSTPFQRSTADTRPLVELELRDAAGGTDEFSAYAQAGATADFDPQYDALKLPNPSGRSLASVAGSGEALGIDGRPAFTLNTVLPLTVGVPAAGPYTLTGTLSNLPAALDALLNDAATGQTINLRLQPAYAYTVSAAQAAGSSAGRFTLTFAARAVTATAAAFTANAVSLYPNPAQGKFTVRMPAVAGATALRADLLNGLGQVVRRHEHALPAAGTEFAVETAGLAAGVYTLRLLAGPAAVVKRVVVE